MIKYKIGVSDLGFNALEIMNDSESIYIELSDFYKDTSNLNTLYDKINEYLETLPSQVQDELFGIFSKVANEEYRQKFTDITYAHKLENNIARACELLNYDNFKIWFSSNIDGLHIPEDIKDVFVFDKDLTTVAEKTYVRSEYINYVALILFIRALSPLYIDYYNYIKNATNHCYYKLFLLLIKSSLYYSAEAEKLREYIKANYATLIGGNKLEHLVLGAGLSDDDIVEYLIAEVIFNKLLTIDFFNKNCNIVSYTFQTIKYKGTFVTSDSSNIKNKTTGADPNKDDISYFEDYRKTSNISIGVVVEIQHALSDIDKLVSYLGYGNFDYNAYNRELSNINLFMENRLDKIQVYLLGWFLSKFINPRALYYIEYRKLVELMLFVKTVLLANGHTFIAMLLSSYKARNNIYINVIIKNTLSKTLIKRIEPYYSFVMEEGKNSVVENTISEVSAEIVNYIWVPIGTEEQISLVVNNQGYLDIPNDLNNVICQYIEFINS